jgi:hypothetical protein
VIEDTRKNALKLTPSEANEKTDKNSLRFNHEEQKIVHWDGRKVIRCSTADNTKNIRYSHNARMK